MSKAKKLKALNENVSDQDLTPDHRANLNCLPDIPVLLIASHLSAKDLISFSYCCKNVFDIFEGDRKVWRVALKHETPEFCAEFENVAATIFEKQTLFRTSNKAKLAMLVNYRTNGNWNTSNGVRTTSLTSDSHRDYSSNFSSHLLVSRMKCSFTDNLLKVGCTIWNLFTGISKDLSAETALTLDETTNPSVSIFDSLLVVHFIRPLNLVGYQMDLADGNLVEVWKHSKPAGATSKLIEFYNKFFVFLTKGQEINGNLDLQVDCISTEDGSNLFSHKSFHRTQDDYYEFYAGAGNDTWFVYVHSNQLFAINLKQKTHKLIKDQIPGIPLVNLKGEKILCHYPYQNLITLYDLSTDNLLKSFSADNTCSDVIDFDPQSDRVLIFSGGYDGHLLTVYDKDVDPTIIKMNFNNPSTGRIPRFMLNNLVWVDQFRHKYRGRYRDKFCLMITRLKGLQLQEKLMLQGDFHGEPIFSHKVIGILKISPFMVALGLGTGNIKIVDFLNIDQYFK